MNRTKAEQVLAASPIVYSTGRDPSGALSVAAKSNRSAMQDGAIAVAGVFLPDELEALVTVSRGDA